MTDQQDDPLVLMETIERADLAAERERELVEALKLVLKRGELVKQSDQYMFEVLDAARAALATHAARQEKESEG